MKETELLVTIRTRRVKKVLTSSTDTTTRVRHDTKTTLENSDDDGHLGSVPQKLSVLELVMSLEARSFGATIDSEDFEQLSLSPST